MKSCLALLVFLAAALPASAQSPIRRSAPDFLFEKPHGAVTIRGSWLFSRGQSDWYDFVTDQLTLERQDFNAPGFGLDVFSQAAGFDLDSLADAGVRRRRRRGCSGSSNHRCQN